MPNHGERHPIHAHQKFCDCGGHSKKYVHRNTFTRHNPSSRRVRQRPAAEEARAQAAPYIRPLDPQAVRIRRARAHARAPVDIDPIDPDPYVGVDPAIDVPPAAADPGSIWSEPLYETTGPTTSIFTAMEAVVMLLYIFTKWAIPRDARRALFDVFRLLLPKGNNLPKHTEVEYQLNKSANEVAYHRHGTCVNNCCIVHDITKREFDDLLNHSASMPQRAKDAFREYFDHAIVNKKRKTCPHCGFGMKRKKHGVYSDTYEKEYVEVDLRKRIGQLYMDKTFAENINIREKHLQPTAGKDIFTSKEWKEKVVDKNIHTQNGGRDLVLCLLADGVCPFSRRKQHSMDVQGAYIMNLDKRFRNSIRNILLTGIVGGPGKVKDEQPYLLSLIIQLLQIEREGGVLVPDVLNPGRWMTVRIHVLWTLGDLPAHNMVWNWSGGYSGCTKCTQKGTYACNRMVWGEYARGLPKDDDVKDNIDAHDHPPRDDDVKDNIDASAYPPRDPVQVLEDSVTALELKALGNDTDYTKFVQDNGTKGLFVLALLGLSPVSSAWYDLMHVLKGFFVHFIYTLKGTRIPKAVGNLSPQDLQNLDQGELAAVLQEQNNVMLTKQQQELVHRRQHLIQGPARFAVRGKGLFSHTGNLIAPPGPCHHLMLLIYSHVRRVAIVRVIVKGL